MRRQGPDLAESERELLKRLTGQTRIQLGPGGHRVLHRLLAPIEQVTAARSWSAGPAARARNVVLRQVNARETAYWAWDDDVWATVACDPASHDVRFGIVALGRVIGDHHRLHHSAGVTHLGTLSDWVFGRGATGPAVAEIRATLLSWKSSQHTVATEAVNAILDLLLTCGSPHLDDITGAAVTAVLNDHRSPRSARRHGLFKISRVLADRGIISAPLTSNQHNRGVQATTLVDVPAPWLEWMQRWRRVTTHVPGTVRSMSSTIMIAGRWAADRHPEALTPDAWTRDIAAEYVADTLTAKVGDWAGHNRNQARFGQPLTAGGMAGRIDSLRGYFADLADWEWLTPRFDPRRVLSLPVSRRAQLGPNPRIIDDAAWAKLMAAGITLNPEDLRPYGTPSARAVGHDARYYPIEMIRALVAVWLFAGCRIDEIRRLDLDCIRWDEAIDDRTGEPYQVCLLHVPANKTTGPFSKPVDPLVGQVIEAWKSVRPPQPDITDRKTGLARQHLFTHRGQLVGQSYLNAKIIPALCAKAGIPDRDSRGALTSHRARATIATQLLNAREPLTLADLQAWLGHKHPHSTRHYAQILQRTLTAAYRKADYFARNQRTIQVLIDRETILTGAAARPAGRPDGSPKAGGGQPWKYYDLGEGYCSYDFFAKCPHRLACARCPFYLPKNSHRGQLLQVKDGIEQMLEQLELTEDERDALEGDRDAVTALATRLADIPTPAGPTPNQLGTTAAFIPLTALTDGLTHRQNPALEGN